jgi:hypothetical protein
VFGGPEMMTGVLFKFDVSLLQETSVNKQHRRNRNCQLPNTDCRFDSTFAASNWQLAIGNRQSLLKFILDCIRFILLLGEWFTGDAILTFNPPAEVDELAPLRTEGTKRIIFPIGRLTAGWAFHKT